MAAVVHHPAAVDPVGRVVQPRQLSCDQGVGSDYPPT